MIHPQLPVRTACCAAADQPDIAESFLDAISGNNLVKLYTIEFVRLDFTLLRGSARSVNLMRSFQDWPDPMITRRNLFASAAALTASLIAADALDNSAAAQPLRPPGPDRRDGPPPRRRLPPPPPRHYRRRRAGVPPPPPYRP